MNTRETSPEPNVSAVHLLVHPGYERSPGTRERQRLLFDRYETFAKTLANDEIILAYLPFVQKLSRNQRRLSCVRRIGEIQEALGDRLVAVLGLLSAHPTPDVHNRVLDASREGAEKEGYIFDENVDSFAWGETLTVCVPQTAQHANERWNLNKKTIILPHLTNWAYSEEKLRLFYEHRAGELRRSFRRTLLPSETETLEMNATCMRDPVMHKMRVGLLSLKT